jgi:hypothetical protein
MTRICETQRNDGIAITTFRLAIAIHSHGDYYLIAMAWLCFGAAFWVKEICDEIVIAEK